MIWILSDNKDLYLVVWRELESGEYFIFRREYLLLFPLIFKKCFQLMKIWGIDLLREDLLPGLFALADECPDTVFWGMTRKNLLPGGFPMYSIRSVPAEQTGATAE